MKAVKVQYTVKPEYVEKNKENIRQVMKRLKSNPIEGMQYSSFVLEDGQTFVHINMAADGATMSKLNDIEEFKLFRNDLKENGPISPPQSTNLQSVDQNFDL